MKSYTQRYTAPALFTLLLSGLMFTGLSTEVLIRDSYAQSAENSRESGPDLTGDIQENRITAHRTVYNNLQTAADIGASSTHRSNEETVYLSKRHGGENVALHSRNDTANPLMFGHDLDNSNHSTTE
ncbi:hypothetical protein ACFOW6_16360 [Fodinicurvata halophila]|uniref:Uncharacterized protein n=1 Tax=Fodinicurvata halophila TaxID=1419723 RepID=A0ABV8UQ31_9PROT